MAKPLKTEQQITLGEERRIVYWLQVSDLSVCKIAYQLGVHESVVRRIQAKSGLENRHVDASLSTRGT